MGTRHVHNDLSNEIHGEPRSRMIDGRWTGGRGGCIKRMPESNAFPFVTFSHTPSRCPVKTGAGVRRNELHRTGAIPMTSNTVTPRRPSPCDQEDHFEYRRGGFLGICPWSGSSPGTTKTAEAIRSEGASGDLEHYALHPRLVPHESDHPFCSRKLPLSIY